MIFFESFEERLADWVSLRKELETHTNPFQYVIDYWNKAPISSRTCDPFDKSTWLGPWELIEDNQFCEFSKILVIYYTLSLTDRYRDSYFEIQIINDREAHELRYILLVDDHVIGYYYNRAIIHDELPTDIVVQTSYPMLTDFS